MHRLTSALILFCCIGCSQMLWSQPMNRLTANKMLNLAQTALQNHNYVEAIKWSQQAKEFGVTDGTDRIIAEASYKLRDYQNALKHYSRIGGGLSCADRYQYASVAKISGDNTLAKTQYDNIINNCDGNAAKLAKTQLDGMNIAKPDTPMYTVVSLSKINGSNSEYSPILDGRTLYFSRIGGDLVKKAKDDNPIDVEVNLMSSTFHKDKFSEPVALPSRINKNGWANSSIDISEDGQRMLITRHQLTMGNAIDASEIAIATLTGGTWSAPKTISLSGDIIAKSASFGQINGESVIYFAAMGSDSYGGYDIYLAYDEGNNQYSKPQNLGSTINGAGDEDTPRSIGDVLYFSSTSHKGLGGYDIFKSMRDNNDWTTPENLGAEINSNVDDLYFSWDDTTNQGFFVSNRGEQKISAIAPTCCNDVYRVQAVPVVIDLMLTAVDSKSNEPLTLATFDIMQDGKTLTPNADGKYIMQPGVYTVKTIVDAYEPQTSTMEIEDYKVSTTVEEAIALKLIPPPPAPKKVVTVPPVKKAIVLHNINFDYDDDKILNEALGDLNTLLKLLKENPTKRVELSSHTDIRGSESYNNKLSARRAASVKRWLQDHGIDSSRMISKGYGFAEPFVVDNYVANKYSFLNVGDRLTKAFIERLGSKEIQEMAHKLNRRTEFKLLN